MEHLPIQRRSGDPAIGFIDEGNGFGTRVIRRDLQDLMLIGCLVIGNPKEEVGSGGKATGSTVNEVGGRDD
jgi:hypothetical protein